MSDGDAVAGPRRSFADKLDHLFRVVHPAGRGEFSYKEVEAGVAARGGEISSAYVWHLRKGSRDNPTLKHMEALAEFFGVAVSYFVDDDVAARVDAELSVIAALRDSGVRHVALRASGLSAATLGAISGIIEQARRLEGLPDGEQEK